MKNAGLFILSLCVSPVLAGCSYSGGPIVDASRNSTGSHHASSFEQTEFNTESYDDIIENNFLSVKENPLSTFSIDVDTASYSNVRRFLNQNQTPPAGAVRIEEFVNYFDYNYPQPEDETPFSVHNEVAVCPWNKEHRLVRIGLKGREVELENRPASNLVFLLDVSGSMNSPDKLPLVKKALKLLIEQLGENDRVAIAVYASASGLVLPSTTCDHANEILGALDRLNAGGSTNGGQGIQLAYATAIENFIEGGINRVILCTDGDFNVGISNRSDLSDLIIQKAKSDVFLSILGFGKGNYKDAEMEELTNKGNGNYAYIDSLNEAKKVLVEQAAGTLITIAKDVKIQVDFNPAKVQAYRLIGYENRLLNAEDFHDDTKDAGEIGAGHTVTAMYEIVPWGVDSPAGFAEPSKYKKPSVSSSTNDIVKSDELLTVRLRYKQPESDESIRFDVPLNDDNNSFDAASLDFQFAASVAEFGLLLRDSKYKGDASFENVRVLAIQNQGDDLHGYRSEFIQLVDKAAKLAGEY